MNFINRLFGRNNQCKAFEIPNNPSDFVAQLSRRKFWCDIGTQLLRDIAQNTNRELVDLAVTANGEMELLKNFVIISEGFQLVENSFVKISCDKPLESPLSLFANALYLTGSNLCQKYIGDPSKQNEHNLMFAEIAFISAILCDQFFLVAYYGLAHLFGELAVEKSLALKWCQKYKNAEAVLIATPDEQLTYLQRAGKEGVIDPSTMRSVDPSVTTVPPPMRQVIEELEQRLLG
jgi:hypothetical protein